MTVYVDESKHRLGTKRTSMVMCHMVADTPAELHAMADTIGLNRVWFQNFASSPHYDICKTKRVLAVKAGAKEIDRSTLGKLLPQIRMNWPMVPGEGWK